MTDLLQFMDRVLSGHKTRPLSLYSIPIVAREGACVQGWRKKYPVHPALPRRSRTTASPSRQQERGPPGRTAPVKGSRAAPAAVSRPSQSSRLASTVSTPSAPRPGRRPGRRPPAPPERPGGPGRTPPRPGWAEGGPGRTGPEYRPWPAGTAG